MHLHAHGPDDDWPAWETKVRRSAVVAAVVEAGCGVALLVLGYVLGVSA